MLEAAEADLALEAGFVQCEGAPGIPENLAAKFVDANKRRFGLRDGGVGPVARCQTYQLHPSCGTESPLDMLMTLQGVYEKSLGTLSPSPRRSARVDARRKNLRTKTLDPETGSRAGRLGGPVLLSWQAERLGACPS